MITYKSSKSSNHPSNTQRISGCPSSHVAVRRCPRDKTTYWLWKQTSSLLWKQKLCSLQHPYPSPTAANAAYFSCVPPCVGTLQCDDMAGHLLAMRLWMSWIRRRGWPTCKKVRGKGYMVTKSATSQSERWIKRENLELDRCHWTRKHQQFLWLMSLRVLDKRNVTSWSKFCT